MNCAEVEKSPARSPLLGRVGNTPLVRLKRILESGQVSILAKLESFNPGGSVKDRAALRMVESAEKTGILSPGKTIIDATSGNTGIALAMIGAVKGYKVLLALPGNLGRERRKILSASGADLLPTDPLEGSDGAVRAVQELHASDPDRYFYVDQFNNPSNWKAHYDTTAPEILRDLPNGLTHFVAGRGTSGTFVGNSRRLKAADASVQAITYAPDSPFHGIEGIKHMETSLTPGIHDPSLIDLELEISTEDAQKRTVELARREGLFVGVSSGAALAAAIEVASNIDRGTIVVIFPDGGDRYVSEGLWETGTGTFTGTFTGTNGHARGAPGCDNPV